MQTVYAKKRKEKKTGRSVLSLKALHVIHGEETLPEIKLSSLFDRESWFRRRSTRQATRAPSVPETRIPRLFAARPEQPPLNY